jgi:hypothetical protein
LKGHNLLGAAYDALDLHDFLPVVLIELNPADRIEELLEVLLADL